MPTAQDQWNSVNRAGETLTQTLLHNAMNRQLLAQQQARNELARRMQDINEKRYADQSADRQAKIQADADAKADADRTKNRDIDRKDAYGQSMLDLKRQQVQSSFEIGQAKGQIEQQKIQAAMDQKNAALVQQMRLTRAKNTALAIENLRKGIADGSIKDPGLAEAKFAASMKGMFAVAPGTEQEITSDVPQAAAFLSNVTDGTQNFQKQPDKSGGKSTAVQIAEARQKAIDAGNTQDAEDYSAILKKMGTSGGGKSKAQQDYEAAFERFKGIADELKVNPNDETAKRQYITASQDLHQALMVASNEERGVKGTPVTKNRQGAVGPNGVPVAPPAVPNAPQQPASGQGATPAQVAPRGDDPDDPDYVPPNITQTLNPGAASGQPNTTANTPTLNAAPGNSFQEQLGQEPPVEGMTGIPTPASQPTQAAPPAASQVAPQPILRRSKKTGQQFQYVGKGDPSTDNNAASWQPINANPGPQ